MIQTYSLMKQYYFYSFSEEYMNFRIELITENNFRDFKDEISDISSFCENFEMKILKEIIIYDRDEMLCTFLQHPFYNERKSNYIPLSPYLLEMALSHESKKVLEYIRTNHTYSIKSMLYTFFSESLTCTQFVKNEFELALKLINKVELIEIINKNISSLSKINLSLLKILYKHGVTFNDLSFENIYEHLCAYGYNRKLDKIHTLIHKCSFYDRINEKGDNLFHHYAKTDYRQKKPYLIRDLLNQHFKNKLSEFDSSGYTPLHYIIMYGRDDSEHLFKILKFIKENSIDINLCDSQNQSLYFHFNRKKASVLNTYCILIGGDPFMMNNEGATPISFLSEVEKEFSLEIFKNKFLEMASMNKQNYSVKQKNRI